MQTFTNQVVDAFALSVDTVEIGVTQFSDTAATVIGLSPNAAKIKAAVSATPQMERNTNTGAGFELAETIIKTQGRAGTQDKIVMLITDGKPNRGPNPTAIATRMEGEGIEIFGIGVGPGVDTGEINSWVSLPVANHSFMSSGWDQLHKILDELVANACKHPPTPPPAEVTYAANLARLKASKGLCSLQVPPACRPPAVSPPRHAGQVGRGEGRRRQGGPLRLQDGEDCQGPAAV